MSYSRTRGIWHLLGIAFVVSLSGCSGAPTEKGARIDNLPMYGQPERERSAVLKKADEDFIAQAASGFNGNREAASEAWHNEGERYIAEGNLDFAMRRYNQAWLLNPKSYKPFWGFGRVFMQKGESDPAISNFEQALQLCNDNYQKPALLSDLGTAWSFKARSVSREKVSERDSLFKRANDRFHESTLLDANWGGGWRAWAISSYEEGQYKAAWEKVSKAQSLNARPFSTAFLEALSARMPRPTGK